MQVDATWTGGELSRRYGLASEAIQPLSFRRLEALLGRDALTRYDARERQVILRMTYAVGDASLVDAIVISPGAVTAGLEAIRQGALFVCDVEMVRSGIQAARADRFGCARVTAIDAPEVRAAAKTSGLPRALHAMGHLARRLTGAVAVIGNAPTALLSLLDLVDAGAARPALIIGTPVGFVAAAEAKEELMRRSLAYITVAGTRGGSPVAVAAANALLSLASDEEAGRGG